jgi:hypothetical protein
MINPLWWFSSWLFGWPCRSLLLTCIFAVAASPVAPSALSSADSSCEGALVVLGGSFSPSGGCCLRLLGLLAARCLLDCFPRGPSSWSRWASHSSGHLGEGCPCFPVASTPSPGFLLPTWCVVDCSTLMAMFFILAAPSLVPQGLWLLGPAGIVSSGAFVGSAGVVCSVDSFDDLWDVGPLAPVLLAGGFEFPSFALCLLVCFSQGFVPCLDGF